jgi:hypothetical protein
MTDWKNITIKALAELVSARLKENGIDAVLVGGACVSIYSHNKYESADLDYISNAELKDLERVMEGLGFSKKSGRHFEREDCPLFVEFPAPPVAIGREMPITEFNHIKSVALLTATDCVKDRLAAYYHWNDPQSLDQALMVAKAQKVDISKIKKWSDKEGASEKFKRFEILFNKGK